MDKIVVTAVDIELLLKWRDQHPDEVRSHPAPLKAVEIVVETNGWRIKGIRNGLHLSLYLNQNGQSFGHCEFVRRVDGMWASTKNRMQVERDDLQSVLTVYCTLMALMAHSPVIRSEDEPAPRKAHTKGAKKPHKRSSTQTTYHHSQSERDASGGSQRLSRKSSWHLHRERALPALQER